MSVLTLWQQPWFWPAVAVVVGLPVILIVLTEVGSNLERRGNPGYKLVRLARNFVVPSAAVAVLLAEVTKSVGSADFTWAKLFTTLFGFLAILFILNAFNLALFTNAESGSWRERLPSIFVDIARIIMIAIGLAILFQVVWGTDVGGLFTALGVTSIVLGLALQGAIGSVVSGLLLLFEQPFRLGDFLEAGGTRGRVIEVNWRAVHIDTGNGVQIIPNASLAGSSFTNLSRGDGGYTVTTKVGFTTDDPPAEVVALLVGVARGLPGILPNTQPVAVPVGGADFELSFEVRGPAAEGDALAVFRGRLWYAARRANLGLDGDTTDAFVTPERTADAVREIAPLLHLAGDDAAALEPVVRLQRFAAGETILDVGVVPTSILFVLRGVVNLAIPLADGGLLPVARVEAGDYLGQTALTREALITSSIALTEVAVLRVPVESLDGLVRARPRLAREFGEVIERRRQQVSETVAAAPELAATTVLPGLTP
ncbi:membrane protein [Frondihabitans sucicola]|uniref:Membrane protein n=1 Tax=Frondihabitans sucicola TaxID=1268041 RepID=A0ABM8GTL2_9MICO|nr:mechanosensitive ion channel domain-containing protein [Frondihabitans sucicola]BDZ51684.1 membrane protein [Frondihabitans sucicola]